MGLHMPHIRERKGWQEYHRRVPQDCLATWQKYHGPKSTHFSQALGTRDLNEADRLVEPVIREFNAVMDAIRANDYPRTNPEAIDEIAALFGVWAEDNGLFELSEFEPHQMDPKRLPDELERFLATTRLGIKRGSPSFQAVLTEVQSLYGTRTDKAIAVTIPAPAATPNPAVDVPVIALDEAVRLYRDDDKGGKNLSLTTWNNLETALRQLAEFTQTHWQSLGRHECGKWISEFLPNRKSPQAPKGQSPATIKKSVSALKSLWEWATIRGYFPATHPISTPWDGQAPSDADVATWKKRTGAKSRRDFRPEETTALLANQQKGERLGDLVRVALLAGVRLEEVAALDASQVGPNANWYEVREGKTDNAARIVPLVSEARSVIAARLKRIHGKGRLFPEVNQRKSTGKYGGALSQEFTRVRRRLFGDHTDDELSEHSLRHTWRTCARRAKVDLRTICEIGGWSRVRDEQTGKEYTDAVYDHGDEAEEYVKAAEQVAAWMRAKGYLG